MRRQAPRAELQHYSPIHSSRSHHFSHISEPPVRACHSLFTSRSFSGRALSIIRPSQARRNIGSGRIRHEKAAIGDCRARRRARLLGLCRKRCAGGQHARHVEGERRREQRHRASWAPQASSPLETPSPSPLLVARSLALPLVLVAGGPSRRGCPSGGARLVKLRRSAKSPPGFLRQVPAARLAGPPPSPPNGKGAWLPSATPRVYPAMQSGNL